VFFLFLSISLAKRGKLYGKMKRNSIYIVKVVDILLDRKGIRTLITLILIFALVFLIYVTRFIFQPVGAYLAAIAVPIIGAGIIFYITNPLVNWLEKKKLPRIIGVFIIFLL